MQGVFYLLLKTNCRLNIYFFVIWHLILIIINESINTMSEKIWGIKF